MHIAVSRGDNTIEHQRLIRTSEHRNISKNASRLAGNNCTGGALQGCYQGLFPANASESRSCFSVARRGEARYFGGTRPGTFEHQRPIAPPHKEPLHYPSLSCHSCHGFGSQHCRRWCFSAPENLGVSITNAAPPGISEVAGPAPLALTTFPPTGSLASAP